MCKHESVMWVEYFRMELLYIQRLRVRREVLGLDLPQHEEAAAATAQPSSPLEADVNASAAADGVEESEAAVKAVLTGAVAGIVFRQAVAALPTDLQMRQRMLQVLGDFSFPGIKVRQIYILWAVDRSTCLLECVFSCPITKVCTPDIISIPLPCPSGYRGPGLRLHRPGLPPGGTGLGPAGQAATGGCAGQQ